MQREEVASSAEGRDRTYGEAARSEAVCHQPDDPSLHDVCAVPRGQGLQKVDLALRHAAHDVKLVGAREAAQELPIPTCRTRTHTRVGEERMLRGGHCWRVAHGERWRQS